MVLHWVGQKVHLGFTVRCYAKTQMNFLVNQLRYFKSRLTVFENQLMVTKGEMWGKLGIGG